MARGKVRHQAATTGKIVAHDHGALADCRVLGKDGFDLARLDTKAAELDLLVEAG